MMVKNGLDVTAGDILVVRGEIFKVAEVESKRFGISAYGHELNRNGQWGGGKCFISGLGANDEIAVFADKEEAQEHLKALVLSLTRPLPFFCYGTLRPGFSNYRWFFEGNTVAEVPGCSIVGKMYATRIPYVLEEEGTVKGVLMYVKPESYHDVLVKVDRLEGFDMFESSNNYTRKEVTVTLEDGSTEQAWCYVMKDKERVRSLPHIVSGDYADVVGAARREKG